MQIRRWLVSVIALQFLAAGAALAAGRAQHGRGMMVPPPAPRIIIGKRDGLHAQMIKRFDKNGDGRLDEHEREAAKQAAGSNPKLNKK